jgi:hypothetical protein
MALGDGVAVRVGVRLAVSTAVTVRLGGTVAVGIAVACGEVVAVAIVAAADVVALGSAVALIVADAAIVVVGVARWLEPLPAQAVSTRQVSNSRRWSGAGRTRRTDTSSAALNARTESLDTADRFPQATRMRRATSLLLALLAIAAPARAAWVVDAAGGCVERWAASDMLRGPKAIVNAPLLPFRQMAGGAQYAWNTEEWWPWQIVAMGPGVTLFSGAAGLLEGTWWITTGVADTLTGGYFQAAPEQATQLSVRPQVSSMIADAAPTPPPTTDRCGRPLAAP